MQQLDHGATSTCLTLRLDSPPPWMLLTLSTLLNRKTMWPIAWQSKATLGLWSFWCGSDVVFSGLCWRSYVFLVCCCCWVPLAVPLLFLVFAYALLCLRVRWGFFSLILLLVYYIIILFYRFIYILLIFFSCFIYKIL
jgi:hypothetical protein